MLPNWLIVSVIITVQMFACPVQVERATYASPYPKQWRNVVITVDPAGQVISARFRPNGQPAWEWPQAYPWSIQGGKATIEGPDDRMKRAGGQYFALTTAVVDVPGNGLPKFPKGYALTLPKSGTPTAPVMGDVLLYSESPLGPLTFPLGYVAPRGYRIGYGLSAGSTAPTTTSLCIPECLIVHWLNDGSFAVVPRGVTVWAAGMYGVAEWPREELR